MPKNKKSQKRSINKLYSVLNNVDLEDLNSDDKEYLKDLSKRIKESNERNFYFKVKYNTDEDSDVRSLEPKVTVHERREKAVTKVDLAPQKEEKKIKNEDEDIFEVEKIVVEGEKFVEVEPEAPKKIKDEKTSVKETANKEKLMEWEPVEIKEPPIKEEPKESELKIDAFEDIKSIDEKIAIVLYNNGYKSIEDLKNTSYKDLIKIKGITRKKAKEIMKEIIETLDISKNKKFVEVEPEAPKKIKDEKTSVKETANKEKLMEWEPVEIKEPPIREEEKIEVFEDLQSVNKKISLLLYDNGYTSTEAIEKASVKDLAKIKGITKKQAKEIKKEFQEKKQWQSSDAQLEEELEEEILEFKEVEDNNINPTSTEDNKIVVFKNIKSIDKKIAKLLIDNKIDTVEALKKITIRDLTKIKGIARKKAKEIKKEVGER